MRGLTAVSFVLITGICFFYTHAASCVPKERDALLDFKHALNDTQHLLASWQQTDDCCLWDGVTCSNKTGNVLKLDLNEVTMYEDDASLAGQISHSLRYLERLEYLDVGNISQTGPNSSNFQFLGSMKSLRHLRLSGSAFSGSIPTQLANLSKLEYLDLSLASFSGKVPPELGNISNLQHLDLFLMQDYSPRLYSVDISWLTRLQSLEYLDLSYVNLSKVIDWHHMFNRIPSLKFLYLRNCRLPSTKQLLRYQNLTTIVELDLSFNNFHHPVASCWFWNVTTIKFLELSGTYLYGPFTTALGNLTSLQWLGFSYNDNAATMHVELKDLCSLRSLHLDGSLSSGNVKDLLEKLPHGTATYKINGVGNCSSLYDLDLSNNHLAGDIPPDLVNISPVLQWLQLSGNNLTGAIPQEIRNSTSLNYLILRSNQLSGQIPVLPRDLIVVDISSNLISGPLLSHFAPLKLRSLNLSSNYITGKIPESICELDLIALDLSNNFMEGAFPKCSRMHGMMVFLHLSNNSLSGMFPSFIQSGSNLSFVDLSWNRFYGTLPVWIGEMLYLTFLLLSHNFFDGHIPISITNLRQLRHLNLAANNLSGTIPWSLSKLTAMTKEHTYMKDYEMDFSEYYITGGEILPVFTKREALNYGANFFDFVSIDFSQNQLTGRIPDEITFLSGVLNLNLSWNHLTGKIPENIGYLKSIESLDISRNNLSGDIPPSLSDLSYLSCMDLSYNNLTGQIPSGRQLDTLYIGNPSMYDGNTGLCGPPLQRNCSGGNLLEYGKERTSAKDPEFIFPYFGLGSGFLVGTWAVLCALLLKKTWRISYYHLFDSAYDRVYVFMVVNWGRLAR